MLDKSERKRERRRKLNRKGKWKYDDEQWERRE